MGMCRRTFLTTAGIVLGTPGATASEGLKADGLRIEKPQVERLDNPLGLEERRPRFSWRIAAGGRNIRQVSYRIRVASSMEVLRAGRADIWDSGQVLSRRSVDVPYAGPELASRQRCYWSVEVADNKGRIAKCAPTWWEMGLLASGDWNAAWVVVEDAAGKAYRAAHRAGETAKAYPAQPAMLLGRRFSVAKSVVRARLYATALGVYEARINGKPAGDRTLAPELTDYRKRLLYQVYDVTELIVRGENVLASMVGDGWYGSPYSWEPKAYMFGAPPNRFLAQLELFYADGTKDLVCTDEHWRIAASPVRFSQIYDGEVYDARMEQPGWDSIGFDDSAWAPAEIGEAPPAVLEAQLSPPIRKVMKLKPVAVTAPEAGIAVFDFGQNFAGLIWLNVKGPAGTEVKLRFAEYLAPSGRVDQSNLRTARAQATYILKGDPNGETWEPRFTYFGFRYAEVSGFPGEASKDAVTGVVIHSDLPATGEFRVGNPVIQKFWQNSVWSQRSNFMGIPTDCPQRDERMGWLGDAQVFWDAASFNMDTDAFANRFMGDVRAGQSADGAFPEMTPHAMGDGRFMGAPGWADGGVIIPWTVFRHYGDTAIIDHNWAAMERWIAYILNANPDRVWRNGRGSDWGDWLAIDSGDKPTPKDLIGTAFWAYSASLMAEMAAATSRTEAYASYKRLAAEIAAAFRKEYVRADGEVGSGSQTSYILALAFGLLPEALRSAAADKLASNIRAHGTKPSTGFLGTPYILDALASHGHEDLAVELLLQTGYPSWGYMVMKGATTMWERWNSDTGDIAMNSYNHYAFGAITAFLYRRIAGIDQTAPGFEQILIRPICDPRLKFAVGSYEAVYGRISTEWRRNAMGLQLRVTLPPNTDAVIQIPASTNQTVLENGRPMRPRDGLNILARDSRIVAVSAGSGSYKFSVV